MCQLQFAKNQASLRAFVLPAPGWFEASNDPAIMTQRLPLVQTFLQAVLTEVHCGSDATAALSILEGISSGISQAGAK
jgi:hypothetical protein